MPEPAILTTMYVHTCVYWAPGAVDDNGRPTFAAPVEVCCRWIDCRETILTDRKGNDGVSRSKVRIGMVVEELGVLWKGCIDDLTDEDDPFANSNAWQIRKVDRITNFRGDAELIIAWL